MSFSYASLNTNFILVNMKHPVHWHKYSDNKWLILGIHIESKKIYVKKKELIHLQINLRLDYNIIWGRSGPNLILS